MRNSIQNYISKILDEIPADTGLTENEVRLELAIKILRNFPRGVQPDVDADLDEAVSLCEEAGTYYDAIVHPEDQK